MTDRAADLKTRYDALDGVRAAAMLLGVLYHAILFGQMFGGGGPPMIMGQGSSSGFNVSARLMDWLHSFRMPLFFLIAGFFCRMMYGKYGWKGYLARRWVRIGLPLIVSLFTLVPLYEMNRSMPGGGGPGPRPGFGPTVGPAGAMPGVPGGGMPGFNDELPPPPPGFVPPPLAEFDVNNDGTLDANEWPKARAQIAKDMAEGGFGPPGGGGFGPPGGGFGPPGGGGFGPPGGGFGPPGGRGFGPPGGGGFGPPGGRGFGPPGGGGGLFSLFRLDFLWFLWYLLVFATFAPLVAWGLGLVLSRPADRWGAKLFEHNLVPVILGLVSLPALLITGGFMGWQLPLAAGIFRAFPGFLVSLEIDMPFYFAYFLTGWWLYRERESLPLIAKHWWKAFLIGLIAHAIAMDLSGSFSMQRNHPQYQFIKFASYAVYTLGSAFTAFGFLGFFQHYMQRPSRLGRYLADTAFWVYLLHEPVMMPILNNLAALRWPWWVQGPVVATLTTLIALALYETIVRPTPLVLLFGPSRSRPKDKPGDISGVALFDKGVAPA